MGAQVASDAVIAGLAERQHGVVAFTQVLAAGIGRGAVRRRVGSGHLYRVHRGVYAVGHRAISREGRWMAAILAVGGGPAHGGKPLAHWGAAISHRSAAELWGLLSPRDGPVDVSLPGDPGRARRTGIRLHRSRTLVPAEVTLRSGIPVTTPIRTIADLEGAFLALCRRRRLPEPEVNVRIGRDVVDFLWRDRRLVVETDGYRYHRGRVAFQDDRRGAEPRCEGGSPCP